MFCKDCGAQLNAGSRFCPRCGHAQITFPPAEPATFPDKVRLTAKKVGASPAFLIATIFLTLTLVGQLFSLLTAGNIFDSLLAESGIALPQLKTTLSGSPALVIGWGRIGKCLAQLLRAVGCPVTVAVRKGKDLATLRSLGYDAVEVTRIPDILTRFRLIFNTAPEPVLSEQQLSLCGNCVKIDLASSPGLLGEEVIRARGLPGKYAPESSGRLIAETLLHYIKEGS
jgi:dipicolinate synthase subunit A